MDMNKLTRNPVKVGKYLTWHQFTYDGILSQEEAGEMQTKAGYNPCGYGFYSFGVKDGKTLWQCSNSCD